MSFYDRYAAIAEKRGLEPCSQKAASLFGSTKATISKWNTKDITPLGSTVAAIADALEVSTDYLLGRTDDPTDFAKKKPADLLLLPKISLSLQMTLLHTVTKSIFHFFMLPGKLLFLKSCGNFLKYY